MSILVYTENTEGHFKKSAFEVVSYAKELAKTQNTEVIAITIGKISDDILPQLADFGADKILHIKNEKFKEYSSAAYSSIIAGAAIKENASIVILSNSFSGKGLAPAVAIKLKAGVVAGAVELPQIQEERFLVKTTAFSGKAYALVELLSPVKVISVSPNSFPVIEAKTNPLIEEFDVVLNNDRFKTFVKETIKTSNKVSLPEAAIVVSGGKGLRGPENWNILEDLAESLGAAIACSKPVSDAGWRPHEEHVGQTGIVISPDLYIAVGISGAIQHVAGISSSKTIVAINKDPEAPIFKIADYGIVGDAFEILPKFTQAVRAFKG